MTDCQTMLRYFYCQKYNLKKGTQRDFSYPTIFKFEGHFKYTQHGRKNITKEKLPSVKYTVKELRANMLY